MVVQVEKRHKRRGDQHKKSETDGLEFYHRYFQNGNFLNEEAEARKLRDIDPFQGRTKENHASKKKS